MSLFVVTGANGFIGRHLVKTFIESGRRVRALTRALRDDVVNTDNIEWIAGDLSDKTIWSRLLEPGCTVINLAYSNTMAASTAVDVTVQMAEACANAKIERLIHCSTVSVYGRAGETLLDEKSDCNPVDAYGQIKLAVEHELLARARGRFKTLIVRPSAVFGEGGEALIKLIDELNKGNAAINYCRSSLFGRRKTHLVPIDTVVAAFSFLCDKEQLNDTETYIISDDNNPLNNFRDVERILMEELRVSPYRLAPLPLPSKILEMLMWLKGRPNINTRTQYQCDKLLNLGFVKPITLEDALHQFARRHRRIAADKGDQ
jgi:nucleoside-diphosphate-sugar epimerase